MRTRNVLCKMLFLSQLILLSSSLSIVLLCPLRFLNDFSGTFSRSCIKMMAALNPPDLLQHLLKPDDLLRLSLASVRLYEIVHACERVRMIVAQDYPAFRQLFLLHLCGLCHFSLLSVRRCEVV